MQNKNNPVTRLNLLGTKLRYEADRAQQIRDNKKYQDKKDEGKGKGSGKK